MVVSSIEEGNALEAVAGFAMASDAAADAAHRLDEAWTSHFEGNAKEPSADWIAGVAARQLARGAALERARVAFAAGPVARGSALESVADPSTLGKVRTQRRRRRENKLLA